MTSTGIRKRRMLKRHIKFIQSTFANGTAQITKLLIDIGPWLESGESCSHKLNLHADCLCVAKRNLQVNRCDLSPEPQKI